MPNVGDDLNVYKDVIVDTSGGDGVKMPRVAYSGTLQSRDENVGCTTNLSFKGKGYCTTERATVERENSSETNVLSCSRLFRKPYTSTSYTGEMQEKHLAICGYTQRNFNLFRGKEFDDQVHLIPPSILAIYLFSGMFMILHAHIVPNCCIGWRYFVHSRSHRDARQTRTSCSVDMPDSFG